MAQELCKGNWDGDNWVHVMCELQDTIGIPHGSHMVDNDYADDD